MTNSYVFMSLKYCNTVSLHLTVLCMCSAGMKGMNFQAITEPIRLFIISNFPSIVKDELAVLQQRAAAQKTAETRITYTLCVCLEW